MNCRCSGVLTYPSYQPKLDMFCDYPQLNMLEVPCFSPRLACNQHAHKMWLRIPEKDCKLVFLFFSAVVLLLGNFAVLLFVYLIEV